MASREVPALNLLDHPNRVYPVLVVMLVGLWLLGGIGHRKHASDGAAYYVGAVGWFGFLITVVVTLLYSLALGIRLLRSRRGTP